MKFFIKSKFTQLFLLAGLTTAIKTESTSIREALFNLLKITSSVTSYFGKTLQEVTVKQNVALYPGPFSKFMGKTLVNSSELFDQLHDNLNNCPVNVILDKTTPTQWIVALGGLYIGYKFYQHWQGSYKKKNYPELSVKPQEPVIRHEHHCFGVPKFNVINFRGINSSLPDIKNMGLANLD